MDQPVAEYLPALPPLVIEQPDQFNWDEHTDVLVVGFGGAGVVAALQARELGASVIAVDRFSGGGATAFSGGVIYAGGTRQQQDSGFDDTPEELFKYLTAEGTPLRSDTLRRFCEGSRDDVEWLEGHGVPYAGNPFVEKTIFPPDGYWLYYTGNEKSPEFTAQARPAPRGHRTVCNGPGGKLYFEKLRESALAGGVKLYAHSPVSRLITDAAGSVIGAEINSISEHAWRRHQKLYSVIDPWRPFNNDRAERAIIECGELEKASSSRRLLRAERGVILCAGGFIYNLALLARHRSLLASNYRTLMRLGSMGDDGSGIALGQSVGGSTALMDNMYIARTIAPPNNFPRGVIVNSNGLRFVNEDAYSSVLGAAICEQPGDGKAWLILGAEEFWSGVRRSIFPGKGLFMLWGAPTLLNILMGGTRRARSLRRLAKAIDVDADGLKRSITEFNTMVRENLTDPLGKVRELLHPIDDSAYYAVNVSLDNKYTPTPSLTMGGLQVDEQSGAVTRLDGTSIPGLYAAGRVAVGLCSEGYMSGLSIADTVFSGRRAGRAVVE